MAPHQRLTPNLIRTYFFHVAVEQYLNRVTNSCSRCHCGLVCDAGPIYFLRRYSAKVKIDLAFEKGRKMRSVDSKTDFLILAACGLYLTLCNFANAETIFLSCQDPKTGSRMPVTIDLSNRTANNAAATINGTAIDWTEKRSVDTSLDPKNAGATSTVGFHIDRVRGILTGRPSVCLPSMGGRCLAMNPYSYNCTKTAAPATKF